MSKPQAIVVGKDIQILVMHSTKFTTCNFIELFLKEIAFFHKNQVSFESLIIFKIILARFILSRKTMTE